MHSQSNGPRTFDVDRRFILSFLSYLAIFLFLAQSPFGLLDWLQPFTAYLSYRFWGLFRIPITQSGPLIAFHDFSMVVTHECTALYYLAIYGAGVLSFRSHSRRYRLAGMLTGAFMIMSLNVLRIGILGMVGHYARGMFELVHVYLWQGAFAVIVFTTWFLWVKKGVSITRKALQAALLSLLACLFTLGLIDLLTEYYAVVVAKISNAVLGAILSLSHIPVTVLNEGKLILFRTAAGTLHTDLTYEVLNAVVLSVLFAASGLSVSKPILARRIATGALLLSLQHHLVIILYGFLFARRIDLAFLTKVLWMGRGFSIVAPVLIWLITIRLFPDRTAKDPAMEQSF